MASIIPYTLYNCKRAKDQTSIAQLVKLENYKTIIKYIDGMFIICELSEVQPVYRFKFVERVDSFSEVLLKDMCPNNITPGIYKVTFKEQYTLVFIIFKDLSAVVYVPNKKSIVFWHNATNMLEHIITNSVLWIP